MYRLHRHENADQHAAGGYGGVGHVDRNIANTWLPVLLHVGRLPGLGAVSLVLHLLLSQRTPPDHLPHGFRLADSRTRSSKVEHSISVIIIIIHIIISIVL